MTTAIRELQADGWPITTDGLAVISPYVTENIKRFGDYPTDELGMLPDALRPTPRAQVRPVRLDGSRSFALEQSDAAGPEASQGGTLVPCV